MKQRGLTLTDVLVVMASTAILLVMLLAFLQRAKPRSSRQSCTSKLKEIGLAFRTWSTDNNDLYPMKYYTNSSGAMQFADASNLFRNFQVMSNELNNPKIVLCPSDMKRTQSDDFGTNFSGSNISYFVGLDADETNSASLLSGDRNITNGTALQNGILYSGPSTPAGWTTKEQHRGQGNVGLSDGSVQQTSNWGLQTLLSTSGLATNRLGMP